MLLLMKRSISRFCISNIFVCTVAIYDDIVWPKNVKIFRPKWSPKYGVFGDLIFAAQQHQGDAIIPVNTVTVPDKYKVKVPSFKAM